MDVITLCPLVPAGTTDFKGCIGPVFCKRGTLTGGPLSSLEKAFPGTACEVLRGEIFIPPPELPELVRAREASTSEEELDEMVTKELVFRREGLGMPLLVLATLDPENEEVEKEAKGG